MTKALAARLREELVKLADSPAAFGLHCYLNRTAILSALEEVEELREAAKKARASIMSAGVMVEHAGVRFDTVSGHKEGRDLLLSAMEAATEAYETLALKVKP